jgi:hypothetical protein
MKEKKRIWTFIVGVGLMGGGGAGCSAGHDPARESTGQTGTLAVALTGSAPSGVGYHLSNAVFEVTNFAVFPPVDTIASGDNPSLQIDLAPSVFAFDYQVSLHDGWTLSEVNADGSETPVSATLLTNFISFTIKPQRTTPVSFQFKAAEQVITTGDGAAAIAVNVDDTLIDDFEDGDGLLAPIGGRNGAWFTFNDGSGVQTPAPGSAVVPEVLDTSGSFLLHTTGSGFAVLGSPLANGGTAFGAGAGATLLFDRATGRALPYNGLQYSGVRFTFFTRSPPTFPLQVSFLVATSATTPPEFGGTCTAGCFDDFGFVGQVVPGDFTFSGGFTWDQLRQAGFGTPVAFDPSTIINLKWIVAFPNFGQDASADSFDFRLDDVAFLPPTGLPAPPATGGGQGAVDAGASPDGAVGPPPGRASAAPKTWSAR